ncbi:MAG: MFS transporter, partial [Mycobacterium sp.]
QTLSVLTRIFPPQRRGVAMSVWGATAGVATLVGPLAGGVLVDRLGWEWIFFVNVPIGIVGLGLAAWLIPALPLHKHRFDLVGVALSGVGIFLIVFALQEGQSGGWAPWIWAVIVGGIGFLAAFVYWQSVYSREPLIPLDIFADRDFSLSNIGVAVIGFATTAMVLPLMFYTQAVCGLSPTRSALLLAPMAITSGLLAPVVGKIVDKSHPRHVVGFGFSVLAIALTWLSIEMTPSTPIWRLVVPFTVMGVGMAFVWQPLAATATRNLPRRLAGASSGVYNATRQVGAVLGSAGVAAFMTSRITAELPPMPGGLHAEAPEDGTLQLPEFLREPFAAAMSQSMLLSAFIVLFGVAAALFMVGVTASALAGEPASRRAGAGGDARGHPAGSGVRPSRVRVRPNVSDDVDEFDDGHGDGHDDDDDYVELTLARPAEAAPKRARNVGRTEMVADEDDTEPLAARVEHPPEVPAETWHSSPAESRHSLLDKPTSTSDAEPIGFVHNGFHVDDEQHFRPIAEFSPRSAEPGVPGTGDEHRVFDDIDHTYGASDRVSHAGSAAQLGDYRREYQRPSRHELQDDPLASPPANHYGGSVGPQFSENEPPRNRHYRADPDDTADYGRHSFRD